MNLKIKNKTSYFYFITYFVMLVILEIINPINSLDELFCFKDMMMMKNGFEFYKDINILFPFLSYIIIYPFVVFIDNIMSIRIFSIVLSMLSFLFIHKIAKTKGVNENLCFLFNITYISLGYFIFIFSEYNGLCFLFSLIALYILIKGRFGYKEAAQIAVLCSFIVLTKHTMGFVFFVCFAIIILVNYYEKTRQFLYKVLLMFGIGIFFVSSFILYLVFNGNLEYFIDLTMKSSFINNAGYEISIVICLVFVAIVLCFLFIKNKLKFNKEIVTLLVYSLSLLLFLFPIVDKVHSVYFLLFLPILLSSFKFKAHNSFLMCVDFCVIMFFSVASFLIETDEEIKRFNDVGSYSYMNIFCESKDEIIYYNDLSKKYDNVYYIGADSCYYYCAYNDYHGYYAILWNGNTGSTAPIDYIKVLEKEENYVLISRKSNVVCGQWDNSIEEYIKNNYEFIESNNNLDLYKTRAPR